VRSRIVVMACALLGIVSSGLVAPQPAAALSCGPCPATTTDRLNLREGPSLSDDVILVMPAGAELEYDPFEGETNGFVAVNYDGTEGWAHTDYLYLFPMSATTTARLNIREDPSLSADVVEVMPAGASVTLLSGPENGFFAVQYQQQVTGWAHSDYLELGGGGGGGGDFSPGDEVVVDTDALNLRSGPGLDEDVLAVLYTGDSMVVEDGPESADGYDWYQVDTEEGIGWVAGTYLALA
jgi:uncharacterized protein YraI